MYKDRDLYLGQNTLERHARLLKDRSKIRNIIRNRLQNKDQLTERSTLLDQSETYRQKVENNLFTEESEINTVKNYFDRLRYHEII
jgi:hypothetical protein